MQDVENEIYFNLQIQGLGLCLKYRISFVQLRSWPIALGNHYFEPKVLIRES